MTKNINPEMLVLARESRGLRQSELARRLSVTQGKVSKIESGLLQVSEDFFDKVVEKLHYPREFFYQTDRVYGYGTTCIYHRKRQSLPLLELRRLIAELNVRRLQISRLLRGAEVEAENRFFRMDAVDFNGDAAAIAHLLRGSWGIPNGPIENLTTAIEAAGGVVLRRSFGTSKIDAMSQWAPGEPPLFFINAEIPADRCRYTLAHEIGHIVMHQVPTPDMEGEADRFAAEFLMPAKDVGPYLKGISLPRLAVLKQYWKVSMAALLKRASDLNKITIRQQKYLWTKMSKQGYRLHEPVQIPAEEPSVLTDIIEIHRMHHGYSVVELANLVSSFPDEFCITFLPAVTKLRIVS
jgi:Zn-dependent peptidase ImmA (M78 family)/DNA-binding XRE family transcriptional regulator